MIAVWITWILRWAGAAALTLEEFNFGKGTG